MEIIRGKIPGAKKVVIYGPEGIGKSTFASKFPNPLFIDTEGSTKDMDVARTKKPSSWTMMLSQIEEVKRDPSICRTLVVDTIDWAEQMCIEHICAKHDKAGIESFGYGNGYVYVKEEFGRFLNKLEDVVEVGVNVVLTAHAQMRKFEQPDELGAYDRYELKLGKKTQSQISPLVKEWSDMLLFANYKTYAVAVDDKGKKHKAQGGKRVMYTSHHPCWDAKNRYGLPEEIEFDYAGIAHIIEQKKEYSKPLIESVPEAPKQVESVPEQKKEPAPVVEKLEKQPEEVKEPEKKVDDPPDEPEVEKKMQGSIFDIDPEIPKALQDLMRIHSVSETEIRKAVAYKGFYTENVLVRNYDHGFVDGCLVSAWDQVMEVIEKQRSELEQDIPF